MGGNATSPTSFARTASTTPIEKNVPNEDKPMLLEHMNNTNLFWFDGEIIEKHKIKLAPKYAHLLGDTSGPKPKAAKSM
jgi:hypothetical protein